MIMGELMRTLPKRMLTLLALVTAVIVLPAQAEYADVVINKRAEEEGMRPVIYPHWFHRIRFTCNVCHNPNGFKMKAGANNITMAEIVDGKFCGMCHNDENKMGTYDKASAEDGWKRCLDWLRGHGVA